MKCKNCSFCKIEYDKAETQMCVAKCALTSKKGKQITYAFTTYVNRKNAMLGIVDEYGVDRVNKVMENKNASAWCPLKKIKVDIKTTPEDAKLTKDEFNEKYSAQIEKYRELLKLNK